MGNLHNKTKYYVKLLLEDGTLAMIKAGGIIPIKLIRDCELLQLDLDVWELSA